MIKEPELNDIVYFFDVNRINGGVLISRVGEIGVVHAVGYCGITAYRNVKISELFLTPEEADNSIRENHS